MIETAIRSRSIGITTRLLRGTYSLSLGKKIVIRAINHGILGVHYFFILGLTCKISNDLFIYFL